VHAFHFLQDDFPAGVAALEHRESVVAVGHLVALLQRGYRHRAGGPVLERIGRADDPWSAVAFDNENTAR